MRGNNRCREAGHITCRAVVLGAMLLGMTVTVRAQTFQEQADAAMFNGDFKKAVDLREQSLVTALKAFKEDDLEVIKLRAELGEAYRAAGRWDDAIKQLDYAWKRLRYDAETKSHWKMEEGAMSLTIAERLGRACQAARRHSDALMIFNTGLSDATKAGKENAFALHFIALLADTNLLLKKDAEADGYVQRATEMIDRTQMSNAKLRAHSLTQLAGLYIDHRQFVKAEPLARKAVESLRGVSPEPEEEISNAEQKLGWVLIQMDRLEESDKLLHHALDFQLKKHTREAVELVAIQSGLAALALKQGKAPEAVKAAEEALRVCKVHNPEQHPDTAACLILLASAELSSGHKTEALDACRQAVEIFDATLGDEHPQSRAARELLEKAKQ